MVIVECEPNYVFAPSFLWLMTGLRRREMISRPLAKLQQQGIELLQGTIENIDPEAHTVRVGDRELTGDYLVIALGAEMAPESIPGLGEAGHNFYTLTGAEALRDARLKLRSGRVMVLVSALPFKCPAAPYEAAMLLEYDFRKRRLGDAIQVDVYTPEPGPMPVAGVEISRRVHQLVESKGIGYHP